MICMVLIDLAHLHRLVPAQHDREARAHPGDVAVPVGHAALGDVGGHVEHHDDIVALDAVAVAHAAVLLLARGRRRTVDRTRSD